MDIDDNYASVIGNTENDTFPSHDNNNVNDINPNNNNMYNRPLDQTEEYIDNPFAISSDDVAFFGISINVGAPSDN